MTKTDLINKIAEDCEMTKTDAKKVVDSVFDNIVKAMANGDDLVIPGFGTFSTVDVPEKKGVVAFGPSKGTAYVTPAHRSPRFKAGKGLKDAVR